MKDCLGEIERLPAVAARKIPPDRAEARKRYHGSSLNHHGLPVQGAR